MFADTVFLAGTGSESDLVEAIQSGLVHKCVLYLAAPDRTSESGKDACIHFLDRVARERGAAPFATKEVADAFEIVSGDAGCDDTKRLLGVVSTLCNTPSTAADIAIEPYVHDFLVHCMHQIGCKNTVAHVVRHMTVAILNYTHSKTISAVVDTISALVQSGTRQQRRLVLPSLVQLTAFDPVAVYRSMGLIAFLVEHVLEWADDSGGAANDSDSDAASASDFLTVDAVNAESSVRVLCELAHASEDMRDRLLRTRDLLRVAVIAARSHDGKMSSAGLSLLFHLACASDGDFSSSAYEYEYDSVVAIDRDEEACLLLCVPDVLDALANALGSDTGGPARVDEAMRIAQALARYKGNYACMSNSRRLVDGIAMHAFASTTQAGRDGAMALLCSLCAGNMTCAPQLIPVALSALESTNINQSLAVTLLLSASLYATPEDVCGIADAAIELLGSTDAGERENGARLISTLPKKKRSACELCAHPHLLDALTRTIDVGTATSRIFALKAVGALARSSAPNAFIVYTTPRLLSSLCKAADEFPEARRLALSAMVSLAKKTSSPSTCIFSSTPGLFGVIVNTDYGGDAIARIEALRLLAFCDRITNAQGVRKMARFAMLASNLAWDPAVCRVLLNVVSAIQIDEPLRVEVLAHITSGIAAGAVAGENAASLLFRLS